MTTTQVSRPDWGSAKLRFRQTHSEKTAVAAHLVKGLGRHIVPGLVGGVGISALRDGVQGANQSRGIVRASAGRKYMLPTLQGQKGVAAKYIGDADKPFGFVNPMEQGYFSRNLSRFGYGLRAKLPFGSIDNASPAYQDYLTLYRYANNPSMMNPRGRYLADMVGAQRNLLDK